MGTKLRVREATRGNCKGGWRPERARARRRTVMRCTPAAPSIMTPPPAAPPPASVRPWKTSAAVSEQAPGLDQYCASVSSRVPPAATAKAWCDAAPGASDSVALCSPSR